MAGTCLKIFGYMKTATLAIREVVAISRHAGPVSVYYYLYVIKMLLNYSVVFYTAWVHAVRI